MPLGRLDRLDLPDGRKTEKNGQAAKLDIYTHNSGFRAKCQEILGARPSKGLIIR